MDDKYEVFECNGRAGHGSRSLKENISRVCLSYGHHALRFALHFGFVLFILMLFYPVFWPFCFVYALWIYADRHTPEKGGRRVNSMRHWKIYECTAEHFSLKLVKTAELPPDDGNYLLACFPHGYFCLGLTYNILTEVTNFSKAFPGMEVYAATMGFIFGAPFTREVFLSIGSVSVSEKSLRYVLENGKGKVCLICPGGVKEYYKTCKDAYNLNLNNRKGFVRVALKSGASLVPVFNFNENRTFQELAGCWYEWLKDKTKNYAFPVFLFSGIPFFSRLEPWKIVPYKVPLTTVVGKPIKCPKIEDPSEELINEYHGKFVAQLKEIFEKFKLKYDANGENAKLSFF